MYLFNFLYSEFLFYKDGFQILAKDVLGLHGFGSCCCYPSVGV